MTSASPTKDSSSSSRPTPEDLVPTESACPSKDLEHAQDNPETGTLITAQEQQRPTQVDPSQEPILIDAPPIPNDHPSPKSTVAGQKRPRAIQGSRASLHKPFKSPIRSLGAASPQPRVETHPQKSAPTTPAPTSKESVLTAPRKRSAFRSPLSKPGVSRLDASTHDRILRIKALESRITDLRSSIRKGDLVQRFQARDDTPLEDLIEKWTRVSQEGARVLLEKSIAQEQVFGGWNADAEATSSHTTQGASWGWGDDSNGQEQRLGGSDQESMDTLEQRMDYEDTLQDLPTVDEALRSRSLPEPSSRPKTMTRMQRMLLSLGVDSEVIGYDPDTDTFGSEGKECS